jgi:hypothetical protein
MANGGFEFLLLTFQYLVGWGIFNLVFIINLFRFVYIENYLPAVVPTARRQVSAAVPLYGILVALKRHGT